MIVLYSTYTLHRKRGHGLVRANSGQTSDLAAVFRLAASLSTDTPSIYHHLSFSFTFLFSCSLNSFPLLFVSLCTHTVSIHRDVLTVKRAKKKTTDTVVVVSTENHFPSSPSNGRSLERRQQQKEKEMEEVVFPSCH